MIVVTGSAGFIGSVMVAKLNQEGHEDLILVDDFSNPEKNKNLANKVFNEKVDREVFFDWFDNDHSDIDFVIHIGARTDTAEFDVAVFNKLNLNYTKQMWKKCTEYEIPLIYASSAATYGMGEFGYIDNHDIVEKLKPLNPYGESKNEFDKWALKQTETPPFWAGFKFFNVYGPDEFHKGRMASVIFHAFHQINKTGKMKLFKSHHPDFEDGKQLRDFVYVKDVVDVLYYFMENPNNSGLYNLGTGTARSFLDLTTSTFVAMGKKPHIEFIDTPVDIRDKYQYFTEADMKKVRENGYQKPFVTLEKGVEDYVKNYLIPNSYV
jgi:ADP-L-glycero-D-manno-heptose 6-epimerase